MAIAIVIVYVVHFVCGLLESNEQIDVDYLLFDYIRFSFLLP